MIHDIEVLVQQGLSYLQISELTSIPIEEVTSYCKKQGIRSNITNVLPKGYTNALSAIPAYINTEGNFTQLYKDGIYDIKTLSYIQDNHVCIPSCVGMLKKYKYYNSFPFKCERCGVEIRKQEDICLHVVDEDNTNMCLSNIEVLCPVCNRIINSHIDNITYLRPFVTVSKTIMLEAAHFLPGYDGKCFFTHGHRYELTVEVTRRVDTYTGMVIDFHKLKDILQNHVDAKLDHEILNNYLVNPTSENLIVYIWLSLSPYLKGLSKLTLNESRDNRIILTKENMKELVQKGVVENEWFVEEHINDTNP